MYTLYDTENLYTLYDAENLMCSTDSQLDLLSGTVT